MLNNDPSNLSKPGAYRAEALEVFGGGESTFYFV